MTVKVTIDRDGCVQCGNCYNDDCPTLFAEGDDGTSEIQSGFREEGDLAKGKRSGRYGGMCLEGS